MSILHWSGGIISSFNDGFKNSFKLLGIHETSGEDIFVEMNE